MRRERRRKRGCYAVRGARKERERESEGEKKEGRKKGGERREELEKTAVVKRPRRKRTTIFSLFYTAAARAQPAKMVGKNVVAPFSIKS